MQNKENEYFFILQSILNTVLVLHTTSPRPFSRPKDDVSSQSAHEKTCDLRLNPPETTVILGALERFGSHETSHKYRAQ